MDIILDFTFAGNTVKQYIFFLGSTLCSIFFLNLFRLYLFSRIKRAVNRTSIEVDDLAVESFRKNIIPVLYLTALFFSIGFLKMNKTVMKFIHYIFIIFLIFFITRFLAALIMFMMNRYLLNREGSDKTRQASMLINTVLKILIWGVSILIILDNLGIKISGLVAGLGIGGIAIAFAAQSILGDVFNYFTIFFDSPFEIGDFLVVGDFAGVVEHIGVKTTRIRSLGGEQVIFANTDLTGSRVRNYKRMQERRILFNFGVTYQTPLKKMKKIPVEIEKIINSFDNTRFDRAHFKGFGDSSLDFEVVYYVLSGEYGMYMDLQQEINFRIMELCEKMKVDFAYPTRTIFIEK